MPVLAVAAKAAKNTELSKVKDNGTVLLVEDEEAVRKMAGIMLTQIGYKVLAAKDGFDAVEALRQHKDKISCVLCDLTMPGMDGWETKAALNKIAPSVPVVITSGYDQDLAMAGRSPGFPQHFLSKPYQLKELGDAIRRAMSGQEAEMPNIESRTTEYRKAKSDVQYSNFGF